MAWYEILGFGVLAGLVCGGFFYALGTWMDWRENRKWRESEYDVLADFVDAPRPELPVRPVPAQRKTEENDADGA